MKISKPEMHDQTSATSDHSSSVQTALPSDFFYNLILQATAELTTPPDKPAGSDGTENKAEEIDQIQSASTNLAVSDNNAILQQLNLVNNTNQLVQPNDATSAVDKQLLSTEIKANQKLNDSVAAINQLDSLNADQSKLYEKKLAENEMTSLLNSQAAVLNAQTTKPADVSQVIDTDNQQVTDDLAAFFAPSMLKNGADQSDKSNKQKMDNISTTLKQAVNKQAVDSIQTTQANAKNAMISNVMPNLIHTQTIQDSLAISPSSEQLNFNTQMPLQHLENKHADTLIQLGSFINGHTVQYAANNPHLFTPDVSASQAGSKTLLQQDYQTKIELMPPSVDALMKESYDAKIKIYPPELGHVIAKLRIDKNSAELMILTENVRVKEIIEANLPELRQNFQNADINLTNVHVQSTLTDTKDQTGQYQRDSERSMDKENTNQQSNEALSPNESPKKSETIIDTYA